MKEKMPWLEQYDDVPHTLEYPCGSMVEIVFAAAKRYPKNIAYSYFGKAVSYKALEKKIKICAKAFLKCGIKQGDRVTVCLPNVPQAVICFYALNLIGAVSNMVHPLSSQKEIEFFLRESGSAAAITLDSFAHLFAQANAPALRFVIVTKALEENGFLADMFYSLLNKAPRVSSVLFLSWKSFWKKGKEAGEVSFYQGSAEEIASVLYSGGTTGRTKGVLLKNINFNAAALQTQAMCHCLEAGKAMLAVLPMFHGFGLGVCIHLMLISGCEAILIPRFNADSFAKLICRKKPNYIVGVPTLFEAMLRNPIMKKADLSSLMGVFSGGDSLPVRLKDEFDAFLKAHGALVQIREGFGMAECVTASCLTPYNKNKRGSIGLPFPDTYYKIVEPDTLKEVPYGELGEICIHGPSVMKGYQNDEEETQKALRLHEDGLLWLHTGDMGKMDEEGFVYYQQRIKRMIVSSGYSIYPRQLEEDIRECGLVQDCCVVGVPDPYRGQKVKAFIILKDLSANQEEAKASILAHCKKEYCQICYASGDYFC